MRSAPLLAAGILALAFAGCLEPQPIQPGPSTGAWTATEALPWFAYETNAGFCGPVCYAAAVVFDDGGTLWVTWGSTMDWGGNGRGNVTSGSAPTMRLEHEPYRDAVGAAFRLMKVDPEVRVYDVVAQTIPIDDYARIEERILDAVNGAREPGPLIVDCDDCGTPRAVIYADEYWNVRLAARDGQDIRFQDPEPEWFIVHDQGRAVWRWIYQEHWTKPRW